ncbi:hypothetical protein B0H19DRAFT_1265450 [Mycena capillaripes]|nr:hypothetical protein B0H19DRAFT_1265450 [Mycena capillaripes]
MTTFQNLNEDILLAVLTRCDVYTVLSVSWINKLIRTLALSKHVWLALVADLITSCLIDAFSDPNFTEYSAPDLRAMVKRLVCGPTWVTPSLHRTLSVKLPDIASGRILSSWTTYVKLLPGGRYFTLENYDGRLECWSLSSGRCVWAHSEKRHTTYAVDVLDGGNTARFLLPCSSQKSYKIVEVDLMTGVSFDIFQTPPDANIGGWWMVRNAVISGDFLSLALHIADSRAVLLINWREKVYLIFHQNLTVPGVAIVPGHLILASATPDPPHCPALVVYTLTSLAPHWRPFVARWRPTATREFDLHRIQQGFGVLPTFIERPGGAERWQVAPEGTRFTGQVGMQLTLRADPLRRDSYALSFAVSEPGAFTTPESDNPGTLLVTYRVSVSGQRLHLVQTSAVPTVQPCKARDISCARYSIAGQGVEDVDLRRREVERRSQVMSVEDCESIHLSPRSGAVTTLSGSSVTVSYYL